MEKESNLAAMLADLANLVFSEKAIRRLQQKWPGFMPEARQDLQITMGGYEHLPNDVHHVIAVSYEVKRLWSRLSEATGHLESLLLSGEFRSGVPGFNSPPLPGIIGIDWKHRELVYRPKTLLQEALYYLLRNTHRTHICANPDCSAPYFMGGRSAYCSTDCSAVMQAAAKRRWWEDKGAEWRKNRPKKPKPSRSRRRKK